uniref:Zinc finger and BTB domain containing 22b n=1 Tax=Hucho hucho TaxID=62062 RepID=A0A4W5PR47_9TELE
VSTNKVSISGKLLPTCSSGAPSGSVVQVCFPSSQVSVLDSLNRQREEGQLCDLSIQVQGKVFKAHRCVLAASSPYFHDQVLLKNMSTVSIPAVMDPLAFESVLSCAYTGQLRMLREDIVNYLTVGSVLQMWHIVDKCTELLKEGRVVGSASQGVIGGVQGNPGCSSSESSLGAGSAQAGGSNTQAAPHPPSRPSLSESQSPSSTNYFSPRDVNFGGGAAAPQEGVNAIPSYCTPSGAEGAFLIEEEDEEEEEDDSFGVSSYQDGDASPLQKRPTYSQPSIMPRKQWVVVKTERPQDDDLIVVSGEEGPDEEEERELEMLRERERTFNISNVRTLSGELRSRADHEMETQSSEDYLKFDSGLMDQTPPQHLHNTQLFPIDMQGNQILMYSQSSLDSSQPIGVGGGMAGVPFKGPNLEHGAVHLSAQGGLGSGIDGLDGGGGGGSGKVFMCHCGKTFTHKSMRDRHINMHLDLRPFNCPVCAKKFKMKHHLTEHMKTHTGHKPYDCHGCGKKFMWRDSFMRHRSHCERRGGAADRSEDGGGSDRTDGISPQHLPHLPLSASEADQGAVGGRSGISVLSPHHSSTGSSSNAVSCLTMASAGARLGVNSLSVLQGQGSVFGLGVSQGGCEEEVCEVGDNDSVT